MINGVMQQITINNTKWGGCTNFISCNNQIRNVNSSFLQCNQNSVLTFRSPNRCRCNDRCSAARYATAKGGKSVITGSMPSEKKRYSITHKWTCFKASLKKENFASGNGKKSASCVMLKSRRTLNRRTVQLTRMNVIIVANKIRIGN